MTKSRISEAKEIAQHFSADYFEARAKFRAACHAQGAAMEIYYNPRPGPYATELTTDVAWFGPRDADSIVILVSGTHGLEGLTGSGCQVAWIRERGTASLPPGVAVLMIHMINPWGAAWRRRQNENNVDLNRNFHDFSQPLPANPFYDMLQPALTSSAWAGPERAAAEDEIAAFRRREGEKAFAAALFQGQYTDPFGIGFGGQSPTWSNAILHQLLDSHCRHARRVAFIDFHTGLGPFGHGMLINTNPADSEGLALAREWFGDEIVAIKSSESDLPYDIRGDMCSAVERALAPATVVTIALEYGTFDVDRLLGLQIEDCRLHNHGDPQSERGREIKQALQHFFYPATEPWFSMVHARALEVLDRAVKGVA